MRIEVHASGKRAPTCAFYAPVVAADDPLACPVWLVYGGDVPKVDLAVRRLRQRAEREAATIEPVAAWGERRSEAGASPGDVADACNALGLLGGRRIVLVSGMEEWFPPAPARSRKGEAPAKAAPKVDLAALLAYIASPAPDTVLVLVGHGDPPGLDGLETAVAGAGTVLRFPLPDARELNAWIAKRAQEARLNLAEGGGAIGRLRELVGDDPLAISSELEKLAVWAAGEPVSAEHVELLCPPDADHPPWDLTDRVAERQPGAALRMLGECLDRRDWEVARALPTLAAQLNGLAVAAEMLARGAGAEDIAKTLGMRSAYPAKKLGRAAGAWSPEELSHAVVRIAAAERETRGDSQLRDRFALERALIEALPSR